MSSSRDQSQYGRKRSNTAQSSFRSLPVNPPLKVGDCKVLNAWVHDVKDSSQVVFNQSWWPGVSEGDVLRVLCDPEQPDASFLFIVPKDEGCPKPQLQISIPKPIADAFGLRNHTEVSLVKVDPAVCSASFVEFTFQDQYLGRNDMWRMGKFLAGQCIYTDQEVSFIGGIAAKIHSIYVGGQRVNSACMTSSTKAVYRSLSAKITIFIQVCRELWEFAGDGERYNEKIVHSFLPALFAKWREAGTNHTVTIVLISRVYYDESEIDYAAGPLRQDDQGQWYKDFFKVITDLEVINEWKPTLFNLKNSFWDFQRDILLTHHYHRATQDARIGAPSQVRLVGSISYAQDGPILEALNLALNPTEKHYIDRSLNVTGTATILISPGTGVFRVSKRLLRLTTIRMLDQGFMLDLVLLTKPPLHQSPVFCFRGDVMVEKEDRLQETQADPYKTSPLWNGDEDDDLGKSRPKQTFWWEPFWISTTFWGKQLDLPFRQDRFIASAKMHEIQMLGLLEQDVLSSIEVPYLPERPDQAMSPTERLLSARSTYQLSKSDTEKFDLDTFALSNNNYSSTGTLANVHQAQASARSNAEKRASQRTSTALRIATIEESPRKIHRELPPEPVGVVSAVATFSTPGLGTSPSQSSLRSIASDKIALKDVGKGAIRPSPASAKGLASKLTTSWLFNPFRGTQSEHQDYPSTPTIVAPTDKEKQQDGHRAEHHRPPQLGHSPGRISSPSTPTVTTTVQPLLINTRTSTTTRSNLSRTYEEETVMPHRNYLRRSPLNTPPHDDHATTKRRSAGSILGLNSGASGGANPSGGFNPLTNPTRPRPVMHYAQTALASRWAHVYPRPVFKHEIKWKSLVTPQCLPLTVEHFPSPSELESAYIVRNYSIVADQTDSTLIVKPNITTWRRNNDEAKREIALAIMRAMTAVRLGQGYQLVVRPSPVETGKGDDEVSSGTRRLKLFADDDGSIPPAGAAEAVVNPSDPIYLTMSGEVQKIAFNGDVITVTRCERKWTTRPPKSYDYQCLIWPKLGGGYTEVSTQFRSIKPEDYSFNRIDNIISGYEHQLIPSIRFWRTRFIVIPTSEPPQINVGPSGEKLNHEEVRILGIEKLAEHFTRLRVLSPDERAAGNPPPPVRLLPTTLDPALSVLDESLMEQLDQVHAAGPLKKKMKSEREIGEMSLAAIAKAMREDDGVPIKHYQWHQNHYANSFIGYDFVSWVVREFRDVSTRAQATEWGVKLQEKGLFEHCKGNHKLLDGHYYYRLKGEYSVPMTPKYWFRRNADEAPQSKQSRGSMGRPKKLLLSQTMILDLDPNKRSDQAERVTIHHDIIHNPATVFHFELQWLGTTPRCIEDQLRIWSRSIERYGLRLVEAYVSQICDIRESNAFQSCYPMRLAVPPPVIPDLHRRIPEGQQSIYYFEYALLHKFGFIVDIEANDMYPPTVEVEYSYRRSPYRYSQFVHRSGVAFVQVLGGAQGFLFLTNRLMAPGRMGSMKGSGNKRPALVAEDLRIEMAMFCMNAQEIGEFWDEQVALLRPAPIATPSTEEPSPLSI